MLESRLRNILQSTRDYARRQGINAEFFFHREHSSLIRLGNSSVALTTAEDLTRLSVEVQDGRRTGNFSLNADIISEEQLRAALHRAQENCAAALETEFDPIFGVVEADVDDATGYDAALAELSPEAKVDLCAEVIHAIKPRGNYDFSGSWSTGSTELYYLTTANDHEIYRTLTDGRLVLVLKEQDKKWELSVEQGGKCAADFSAAQAMAKFDSLLPIYEGNAGYRSPLGYTRVMFGPQAIAELVGLAIWGGFFGRFWEEQRAFTSGKAFGDPLFSPLVTLTDDPAHPNVFNMPIDLKGKLRRPFPLVEAGAFRGLIYDSGTAAKYRKAATGHDGVGMDLVFAAGDAPGGLEAGKQLAGDALYIPHLHYVHLPDPTRGQFTGSSRFNALHLEGGAFTAPLVSTRITDTIPNVLSHVVAVSSHSVLMNMSSTYGRRSPEAISVPEYLICDQVRISDVAEGF
ncbi:MAG: metallopeptidase TldD-related protein [Armatimonadota bacterium]